MMCHIVKRIFLICIPSFLLIGCVYRGIISENGLPRRKIKEFREKNVSVNNIDTLALYKTKIYFGQNSITKEYVYYQKEDDNTYPYVGFLKFYPNNKLGLFIILKSDTIRLCRNLFNPSLAKMGYYFVDGKTIKTKISTIGDGTLYISKDKGEIKGDTIILKDKNYSGKIYVKQKIPVEYLANWKPDW